jgi:hypothetical protein
MGIDVSDPAAYEKAEREGVLDKAKAEKQADRESD